MITATIDNICGRPSCPLVSIEMSGDATLTLQGEGPNDPAEAAQNIGRDFAVEVPLDGIFQVLLPVEYKKPKEEYDDGDIVNGHPFNTAVFCKGFEEVYQSHFAKKLYHLNPIL